ncbi:EAL domain-containing protein [bacterium]|nr:EAL domain-containing protein [bacterium]
MRELQNIKEGIHKLKRTVLVVDDELINRELLGMILQQKYDVVYAENGKNALDIVKTTPGKISLILLDLLMPELNGYEVLKTLQSDANLKKIPVIVLTSEKDAEVESLQLGAADFISKPYNMPEVIMARVQHSIELAEDSDIILATETDHLTRLYNKDFFFQYCAKSDLYTPGRDMDAIAVNISRFHLVNELCGRGFGDQVLCTVADEIKYFASQSEGLAGRSGDDLFFVYLPHRESHEKFLEGIDGAVAEIAGAARINLRMGVYQNVDHSVSLEERFDRAVIACNSLRKSASEHYALYDSKLHEKELFSEKLINEMDSALAQRQFKVVYQPKFNIKGKTPRLCSAEALVRWNHPELGMVSPGLFIPLFEENGLISRLDEYVWREVAHQIKIWKEEIGMTVPVSVNVSRIDLLSPNYEKNMLELIRDNSLQTGDMLLEITESAYTENSDRIIGIANSLRARGFKLEMDDFGSGYSSLNMLASLPIDALKLDMKFVRRICENAKDLRMVQLMIEIAAFLNVPVIAEGVETEEQYRLLKENGCDIIQGYYFSKPLPVDQFSEMIEKEGRKRC